MPDEPYQDFWQDLFKGLHNWSVKNNARFYEAARTGNLGLPSDIPLGRGTYEYSVAQHNAMVDRGLPEPKWNLAPQWEYPFFAPFKPVTENFFKPMAERQAQAARERLAAAVAEQFPQMTIDDAGGLIDSAITETQNRQYRNYYQNAVGPYSRAEGFRLTNSLLLFGLEGVEGSALRASQAPAQPPPPDPRQVMEVWNPDAKNLKNRFTTNQRWAENARRRKARG